MDHPGQTGRNPPAAYRPGDPVDEPGQAAQLEIHELLINNASWFHPQNKQVKFPPGKCPINRLTFAGKDVREHDLPSCNGVHMFKSRWFRIAAISAVGLITPVLFA